MGRRKSTNSYAGLEPGLSQVNKIIRISKNENHETKTLVEKIVKKIMAAMKKQSPSVFGKLYVRTFGAGSSYEGLRIGPNGDYDIDILLKIPEVAKPTLHEDTIPGFVQLQLVNFWKLKQKYPELYQDLDQIVDKNYYLLTEELKSAFMQSIFDKTMNNYFPKGIVTVKGNDYEVYRVRKSGPGFTLSIKGINTNFFVEIDLVPCILLNKNSWPKGGFKCNPCTKNDFFIVAKQPKRSHPHLNRYFRLSFQIQERVIISNRFWMKPTIRIIKSIKKQFDQKVSSYAIKTLFMWELFYGNPDLNKETPELWKRSFSGCLVHMLERYLQCLTDKTILYFWNKKLNLLDNLSEEQINSYRKQIDGVLKDIKEHPSQKTIFKYLKF